MLWLITGFGLFLSYVIFYYSYKLQLKESSKLTGAIGLILIMLLFGLAMPFINMYVSNVVEWEIKSARDEIGLVVSHFATWTFNLLLGIFFLLKFLLTHNKNEAEP